MKKITPAPTWIYDLLPIALFVAVVVIGLMQIGAGWRQAGADLAQQKAASR